MSRRHRKPTRWRGRAETLVPPVFAAGLLGLGVFDPLLALILCVAGWIVLDVAERLHGAAKTVDQIIAEEAPGAPSSKVTPHQ